MIKDKTQPRYSVSRKGYQHCDFGCKYCGESNPDRFYGAKKTECKHCFNKRSVSRRQSLKKKAVEHLGGKCQRCGYSKYIGALEFHHKDPSDKDLTIADSGKKWDNIKEEVEKCMLLCANCHREIHYENRLAHHSTIG